MYGIDWTIRDAYLLCWIPLSLSLKGLGSPDLIVAPVTVHTWFLCALRQTRSNVILPVRIPRNVGELHKLQA
jgi:hypothetical protein